MKSSPTSLRRLGLVAAVLGATLSPRAQDTPAPVEFVRLSELEGASVRPAGEPTSIGTIEDVTVDTGSGSLGVVSLRIGARRVEIPCSDLSRIDGSADYRLRLTAEEIGELPDAPPRPAAAVTPPPPAKAGEAGDAKPEASGKPRPAESERQGEAPTTETPAVEPIVAASSLRDVAVTAGGRTFGRSEDLVFETQSSSLAFVEVQGGSAPGHRGEIKWVPWSACRCEEPRRATESGARVIAVDTKGRDLEKAPGPDAGVLDDPLFRGRLYRYFGVEPPAFEPR